MNVIKMDFIDEPGFELRIPPREFIFCPLTAPKSLIATENYELKDYTRTFYHNKPPTPLWNNIMNSKNGEILQELGERY